MRGSRMILFAVALALSSGTETAHGTPLGTGFTYQGQLKDGGVPAGGDYDFVFRLYDAETGGAQVGGDVTVDDWPVVDGLFTLQLDFGAGAFNSQARWLAVAVRPGADINPHTDLLPRQPVTAAPVALFALDGPGSSGYWAENGTAIYNTNSGFVGVGRSTPIVPSTEFFGVLTPTGDNAYGGMHIQTESASGWPYYGYSTTSGIKAWTYFDTGADKWHLYAGGPRLTVERGTGNVGIGTTSPLSDLHVAGDSPVLRLQDDGDPASFTSLMDALPGQLRLYKYTNVGTSLIDMNPMPLDGTSNAAIRFFRETNTTGGKWVGFHRGDNTNTVSAGIGVDGADSYFQLHGGNVGIGTPYPWDKLHVVGNVSANGSLRSFKATGDEEVFLGWGADADGADMARIRIGGDGPGATNGLDIQGRGNRSLMRITGAGNVGIGTTDPVDGKLSIASSATDEAYISLNPGGAAINDIMGVRVSESGNNTTKMHFGREFTVDSAFVDYVTMDAYGNVGIGTTSPGAKLEVNGTARVDVLEIVGADVAERFPVSEKVQPGMVVAIDPKHPGKLCLSRGAYNRCVAGVVSGAGDIPTGAILGNLPGSEDAPAIALTGRVWVHCDASLHKIAPGDLLTTAQRAGHAMKVTDHVKAGGAIIGKAMTALEHGTGLVLVLVRPQ